MNRLNLKWVTEIIGDEYKKWRKGDIITIQAQTGTGKTYFIKNELIPFMDYHEHMLILANRINLKRQLKKDLLKNMREEIPKDIKELDNRIKFGNVIIMSYQQLNAISNGEEYGQGKLNLDFYDYIVCDECHFILSDSGFNNKAEYSIPSLIRDNNNNAIKIFITATMEEIKPIIEKAYKDNINIGFGIKPTLYDYTTGTDYSYLNAKYFNNLKDIALTIKNANIENGKWLVFVTKKKDAKYLKDTIGDQKKVTIITKDTKDNEDLNSIINESKFKSDVLICTKALDNGVNIQDENVKNIVVMAWDRITFIQELGRIRQDIEHPYEINLYIHTRSKKAFDALIKMNYLPKFNKLDEFMGTVEGVLPKQYTEQEKEDIYNKFCAKYNREFDKLPKDIFYLNKNEKWDINKTGWARLYKDDEFAQHMIVQFDISDKFAFIREQLSWIGLESTFNEMNLIEDVIDLDDTNKLINWLDKHKNERLFSKEQQELSDLIIKELTTIGNNIDYRTKKLKPSTIESLLRNELGLPYAIKEKGTNVNPKTKSRGRWIKIGKIN